MVIVGGMEMAWDRETAQRQTAILYEHNTISLRLHIWGRDHYLLARHRGGVLRNRQDAHKQQYNYRTDHLRPHSTQRTGTTKSLQHTLARTHTHLGKRKPITLL